MDSDGRGLRETLTNADLHGTTRRCGRTAVEAILSLFSCDACAMVRGGAALSHTHINEASIAGGQNVRLCGTAAAKRY
jgi:hypothetical protein